jgi:hypothetical protein
MSEGVPPFLNLTVDLFRATVIMIRPIFQREIWYAVTYYIHTRVIYKTPISSFVFSMSSGTGNGGDTVGQALCRQVRGYMWIVDWRILRLPYVSPFGFV